MPQIRVSAQLQPQHSDWSQMRDAWSAAEALGVDCLFNWDHFYPLRGEPEGKHFEALTVLGAMAEVTERVELGSLVICNSYRNPEYLADAHRTLDHISGGRAILGIGAGWFEKDFDEYGYEFGTAADRLRELREAMPRIVDRLGKLNPPPVNGRLPILIGGSGPQVTLKLVAQYGDMWHAFGDADAYKAKNEILLAHCRDVGRDETEIERTWAIPAGDLRHADALVDAGVTHLIVGVGGDGRGYDLTPLRELVAWRDA